MCPDTSVPLVPSADMSYGQFGTVVEVSWVRSVSGPKCLYTGVAAIFLKMLFSIPVDRK